MPTISDTPSPPLIAGIAGDAPARPPRRVWRLLHSEPARWAGTIALYCFPAWLFIRAFYVFDPDIWWHLRTGQWILQHHAVPATDPFSFYGADKPWVVYSWLFDIVMAGLYGRLGLAAIAFYEIAVRLVLTVALFHTLRNLAPGFWRAAALTTAALFAMSRILGPRPGMLTILLIIILFDVLLSATRTGRTRWLWLLPPTKFADAIPIPALAFLAGLFLLTYFGVVFVIDLEHRLILHPVSIFGAVLGLGVGWLLHGLGPTLLGGLGGFGVMFIFYLFGTLFARIRARKMRAAGQESDDEEALGAGDVILASVLGFMLGWPLIWFGLLVGILLGGLITIPLLVIMLVVRRYKQDAWMVFIPYGPFFLISATLIIYFPNLLSALVPK